MKYQLAPGKWVVQSGVDGGKSSLSSKHRLN
jgi:hypothetical protein